MFLLSQKMLIFLNTLVAIDSDGLKVIRTCGLLCVELISGRHTSKQCNRIFLQCNANFKSFHFEVLISIGKYSPYHLQYTKNTYTHSAVLCHPVFYFNTTTDDF